MYWAVACVLLAAIAAQGTGVMAAGNREIPTIPTAVELVSDNVSTGVIHGWHSNHLLMYKGVLYADGRVDDAAAKNRWKCSGAFFRREPGGTWRKIATIPQPRT